MYPPDFKNICAKTITDQVLRRSLLPGIRLGGQRSLSTSLMPQIQSLEATESWKQKMDSAK